MRVAEKWRLLIIEGVVVVMQRPCAADKGQSNGDEALSNFSTGLAHLHHDRLLLLIPPRAHPSQGNLLLSLRGKRLDERFWRGPNLVKTIPTNFCDRQRTIA